MLPPKNLTKVETAIRMLLEGLGEDPNRAGIKDTPMRVAKMYSDILDGNFIDVDQLRLTSFDDEQYEGSGVQVHHVPFYAFCVVGSTFIDTPRGRVPIQYLKDGDWIYTVDPISMELSLTKAVKPHRTQRNASLVRVVTDNDALICTPNHRFLLTTGQWKEAQHLVNNDRVVSLYRSTYTQPNGVAYPRLVSTFERHRNGTLITDGTLAEHQFVAQQRQLVVPVNGLLHHEDHQTWNNVPENLSAITRSEHNIRHQRTRSLADNQDRKDAAAEASGRPEVRAQRSESLKAYWQGLTEEQRQKRCSNMSEGCGRRNHTVLGVEPLEQKDDVWCMSVPGTETFFANGMAVHNCEHHLALFQGHFGIAYIPSEKIIGLSKLVRIFRHACKKITIQERITKEAVDLLMDAVQPHGAICYVTAAHSCMCLRGVKSPGSMTTTIHWAGTYDNDPGLRQQFIAEASK